MNGSLNLLESYLALCDRLYNAFLKEHEWIETHSTWPEAPISQEKAGLYQELEAAMESFLYFKDKPTLDNKSKVLMQHLQNKLMQLMMLNQDNEASLLRIQMQQEREQNALQPISARRASAVYQTL